MMEGLLPETPADLSGTLFFNVPAECIKGWSRKGDRLDVSFVFHGPGKEETSTVTLYEPGSPEDLAMREREIRSAISTVIYRIERSIYSSEKVPYTASDVLQGRYPYNSKEGLRLYSGNDAE